MDMKPKINQVAQGVFRGKYPQASLGYVRGLLTGSILLKVLVDTGNLGRNVISEDIVKAAKLPVYKLNVGVKLSSASGSPIEVVGETTFKLRLENLDEPLLLKALVCPQIEGLNLGNRFLQEHRGIVDFRGTPCLELYDTKIKLRSRGFRLNDNSTDSLFEKISKTLCNIPANLLYLDLRGLEGRVSQDVLVQDVSVIGGVRSRSSTTLPPQSVVPVEVGCVRMECQRASSLFFTPKDNNSRLNHKSILPLGGLYSAEDGKMTIQVANLSDREYVMPAGCKLGFSNPGWNSYTDLSSFTNNHIQEIASIKKLESEAERKKFLFDKLRLAENQMLTAKQKDEVVQIFLDNFEAVSEHSGDLGKSPLLKFKIRLKEGAEPVRARLRPLNPDQRKDLERQLDEWLSADVIEPSESEWAAALVPVKKKLPPGESAAGRPPIFRWAVDFRPINRVTVKDSYPVPLIAQNLESLSGAKIFSSLDAASAYHAVEIDESSRPYTAFVTPRGLYQFRRMPFGLANSPAIFCRLVQMALDRLPAGIALGYLDDILVVGQDVESHLNNLRKVVELHKSVGLKLNIPKCDLFKSEVEYLGHKVGEQGIRMVDRFVQRIRDWPIPTTGGELRSFLGFVNYYRAFIPKFTELTCGLNKLRTSAGKITLTEEQLTCINKLKAEFEGPHLRAYPDFETDSPFILETDWSAQGIGAILKQSQGGVEKFIGCASRTNNKHESNYPAHKGELSALVFGCKKFEHLLSYRPFVVRTDSTFLKYLSTSKDLSGIFFRWLTYLSRFSMLVEYRKGSLNEADGLSRVQWPEGLVEDREVLEDDGLDGTVNQMVAGQGLHLKPKRDLMLGQLTDTNIQRIKSLLLKQVDISTVKNQESNETLAQYLRICDRLTVIDDLVYYVCTVEGNPLMRVCVPSKLIGRVLTVAHEGHPGVTETYQRVKTKFYWPCQKTHVEQFVASCATCAGKTSWTRKPKMFHREIVGRPNFMVTIDFVGPLPAGRYEGKRVQYICTMLDVYSRYLVAEPTAGATSQDAIQAFLHRWVWIYGAPCRLHSDRGTHFTSTVFKEVCKRVGIHKSTTLGYNPTGNARLERAHGSFKLALRGVGGKNWTENLARRVFSYNISVHRITKFSPFELFFGRLPNLAIDSFFPPVEGGEQTNFERLRAIEETCNNQSAKIVERECRLRFQYLASGEKFRCNDLVWYFQPESAKLTRRWVGPYRVNRIINESVLELMDGTGNSIRVLKYKVKRYVNRKDMLDALPGGLQDLSDDEDNDDVLNSRGEEDNVRVEEQDEGIEVLPGRGETSESAPGPEFDLGHSDDDPEQEGSDGELTVDSEMGSSLDSVVEVDSAEPEPFRKSDIDEEVDSDPEPGALGPVDTPGPEPEPKAEPEPVSEPSRLGRSTRAAADVAAGRIADLFKQRRA